MNRPPPPLSTEIRSLLEGERAIPPQPPFVRARALARARAAMVAEPRVAPVPRQAASRARWAFAAALACVASAAVGATAYEIRARLGATRTHDPGAAPPAAAPPAAAPASSPVSAESPPTPTILPAGDSPSPPARAALARPRLSNADAARAELQLLRQARAAVAREDFAAALPPLAEHARRFRDGRLVEEREALRIKALAGLGRMDEARRAATAFEARFPRSVLLPAVTRIQTSGR